MLNLEKALVLLLLQRQLPFDAGQLRFYLLIDFAELRYNLASALGDTVVGHNVRGAETTDLSREIFNSIAE